MCPLPLPLVKDLIFKIVSLLNISLIRKCSLGFPGKVLSEAPSFRKPGREGGRGGEVVGVGGQTWTELTTDWTSDWRLINIPPPVWWPPHQPPPSTGLSLLGYFLREGRPLPLPPDSQENFQSNFYVALQTLMVRWLAVVASGHSQSEVTEPLAPRAAFFRAIFGVTGPDGTHWGNIGTLGEGGGGFQSRNRGKWWNFHIPTRGRGRGSFPTTKNGLINPEILISFSPHAIHITIYKREDIITPVPLSILMIKIWRKTGCILCAILKSHPIISEL